MKKEKHRIPHKLIDKAALEVLETLIAAGYDAYLVGGCVRDLLLGHHPKDFDVVTNALPAEIKKCFRRCFIIGRRFRLAHVHIGQQVIEVATFRGEHDLEDVNSNTGFILSDNVYGLIEEDAFRRDFTINALFYDIKENSILDFCNGYKDLKNKTLKIIGDPETRFREDPVRMIRAVRIAAKIKFNIDRHTKELIEKLRFLLSDISSSRLYEEVIKLFHCGHAVKTFPLFEQYGLMAQLFPATEHHFHQKAREFLMLSLKNTDKRIQENKPVSPAFLFATFLWYPLEEYFAQLESTGKPKGFAFESAASHILNEQAKITHIPRRFKLFIREIWYLQHRLEQRRPRFIIGLLEHPQFRAAYDFLLLRSKIDTSLKPVVKWWEKIQSFNHAKQDAMIEELSSREKQ
jgi:poly(A) polymerase